MARRQSKQTGLSDFTYKILSGTSSQLIPPFPKNIHQLLSSYIQLCFFTCLIPYRLVYNPTNFQYEVKSNIFQKVLYKLLWTFSIVHQYGELIYHIIDTKSKDPISILLLLGGTGHLVNFLVFLSVTVYYKNEIKDLLNFFIAYSSSSISSEYSHVKSDSNRKSFALPSESASSEDKPTVTFKRIGVAWWSLTLAAAIKCTGLVDKIFAGTSLIHFENSDFHKLVYVIVPPGIVQSSSIFSSFLRILLTIIAASAYMQLFCGVFIFGLEVLVALTVQFIASNFTRSLTDTKDCWKPSSNSVSIMQSN